MISPSDILHGKILIVDDQAANVTLLDQMLRSAGYVAISSTQDPRAVAELYRQNQYDLILLDLQMPGLDGFQVMEELKDVEMGGYLPVLVITAQPGHKLRALHAGAKDFISKPFDFAEVLLRVSNMLEVRLLHMEAKKLQGQLQSANEELQAFSYSASHDLRTPLAVIAGFVGLMEREAGKSLSEKSRHYLTTITRATKRMENLIDDLLAFSRAGRAELKKTDINLEEMVRATLDDFQLETKGRNIVWEIRTLPIVQADGSLLRLVLVNLISNAVKFTGARAQAKIEIGCLPNGDGETVVFIRDNGAGFDPKYTEKLFGVFQRLHSQAEFEGTGIGLANVQRIIHRHGGRTWAEGIVDGGATFSFSLPKSGVGHNRN